MAFIYQINFIQIILHANFKYIFSDIVLGMSNTDENIPSAERRSKKDKCEIYMVVVWCSGGDT